MGKLKGSVNLRVDCEMEIETCSMTVEWNVLLLLREMLWGWWFYRAVSQNGIADIVCTHSILKRVTVSCAIYLCPDSGPVTKIVHHGIGHCVRIYEICWLKGTGCYKTSCSSHECFEAYRSWPPFGFSPLPLRATLCWLPQRPVAKAHWLLPMLRCVEQLRRTHGFTILRSRPQSRGRLGHPFRRRTYRRTKHQAQYRLYYTSRG